jgi:amino acid adenylation domain-containing protein
MTTSLPPLTILTCWTLILQRYHLRESQFPLYHNIFSTSETEVKSSSHRTVITLFEKDKTFCDYSESLLNQLRTTHLTEEQDEFESLSLKVTFGCFVNGTNYCLPDNWANCCHISLLIVEKDGSPTNCEVSLNARSSLQSPPFLQQLVEQLVYSSSSLLGNPKLDCSILSFEILPENQKKLMHSQCGKPLDYDRTATVHSLILKKAIEIPTATAISSIGSLNSMTYENLIRTSKALAIKIQSNVSQNHNFRIAILMEKSIDLLVCVLGILFSGAAYVPIDVHAPFDRIQYIYSNSNSCLLITKKAYFVEDSCTNLNLMYFDEIKDKELTMETPFENIKVLGEDQQNGEDIFTIIYTSGSTGQPKGVLVPHRCVVNDILGIYADYFSEKIISKVLWSTNLCFDAHFDEVFVPLVTGGEICVTHNVLETGVPEGITYVQATPSVYTALTLPKTTLCAVVCGEAVTELVLTKLEHVPLLLNIYGPTETTNECLVHRVRNRFDRNLIGLPIRNVQIYILDQFQRLSPQGAWGELYIGGDGVTCGYCNNPDITKKSFLVIPSISEGILYKTGDWVRYDFETGEVEFGGRMDSQMKVRGMRVDLNEIKSVLLTQNASLTAAHVILHQDQITAYLAPKDINLSNLNLGTIPYAVRPSVIVLMESLPLLGSGKLNVKSLPLPFTDSPLIYKSVHLQPIMRSSFSAPDPLKDAPNNNSQLIVSNVPSLKRTQSESQLTSTLNRKPTLRTLKLVSLSFTRALSLDNQAQLAIAENPQSNFFELGGTSISIFLLLAEIGKLFHIKLPFQAIIQFPTIFALSCLLEEQKKSITHSIDILRTNHILLMSAPKKTQPHLQPPVFFIHSAGGQIHTYATLAAILGDSFPFYGVQDPALLAPEPHYFSNIDDLAKEYASNIDSLESRGPLYLGGHSTGGTLAFAVGEELKKKGRDVKKIFILDTVVDEEDGIGFAKTAKEMYEAFKEGLFRQYADSMSRYGMNGWGYCNIWNFLKKIFPGQETDFRDLLPMDLDDGRAMDLARLFALLSHHEKIEYEFSPMGLKWKQILHGDLPPSFQSSTIPLTIFRTDQDETPTSFWRYLSSEYQSVLIPNCNHYSMLRPPHVEVMCNVIQTEIEKCENNRMCI